MHISSLLAGNNSNDAPESGVSPGKVFGPNGGTYQGAITTATGNTPLKGRRKQPQQSPIQIISGGEIYIGGSLQASEASQATGASQQ